MEQIWRFQAKRPDDMELLEDHGEWVLYREHLVFMEDLEARHLALVQKLEDRVRELQEQVLRLEDEVSGDETGY